MFGVPFGLCGVVATIPGRGLFEGDTLETMEYKTELLKNYYELICLCEDYYTSGYRLPHSVPDFTTNPDKAETMSLEILSGKIKTCSLCRLCDNRLQAVPGEGVTEPLVMVVGEAPGSDEDRTGRPFVGKAGQYLDKWLHAIDCSRDANCYIANVIKCRPPDNRDPLEDELTSCYPYLQEQIRLLKPKVILTVGRFSSQLLSGLDRSMGELRGGAYFFDSIPVVPTYHPSAVLRDQSLRAKVWEDLKRLKDVLAHVAVL